MFDAFMIIYPLLLSISVLVLARRRKKPINHTSAGNDNPHNEYFTFTVWSKISLRCHSLLDSVFDNFLQSARWNYLNRQCYSGDVSESRPFGNIYVYAMAAYCTRKTYFGDNRYKLGGSFQVDLRSVTTFKGVVTGRWSKIDKKENSKKLERERGTQKYDKGKKKKDSERRSGGGRTRYTE